MIKKILVLISFSLITFSMMGQIDQMGGGKNDGFFSYLTETRSNEHAVSPLGIGKVYFFSEGSQFEQFIEESVAPLGNGLVLLSAASLCYAYHKRRKETKK